MGSPPSMEKAGSSIIPWRQLQGWKMWKISTILKDSGKAIGIGLLSGTSFYPKSEYSVLNNISFKCSNLTTHLSDKIENIFVF